MKSAPIHFFILRRKKGFFYSDGFTLIVTVALMVLLMILAVAMLSLSGVSLRTSSTALERGRAMANARAALIMAIGELQRHAGPDTRVTARADILSEVDDDHPPVLGVWRSWEGRDHSTTGMPIVPNYNLKKQAWDSSNPSRRFLGWLTSGDPSTLKNPTVPPNVTPGSNKVTLVGNGSVGSSGIRQQIHLSPVMINKNTEKGAYAWWIGGENQKARLPNPVKPNNDTTADWSMFAKSHSVADPKVFRMEKLLQDAAPALKAISLLQSDLIADNGTLPVSREFFHDLSATSTGLLINTATGGWRKDLSLLTENWSNLGTRNLPFFQVTPGNNLNYSIPTVSDYRPTRSLFYPWAFNSNNPGAFPIYQNGPVRSWANLQEWATLYKNPKVMGSTLPLSVNAYSERCYPSDQISCYNYLHLTRFVPVLARVQWIFSYWAQPTPPPAPPNRFDPCLLMTPVITIWNPYNVALNLTQLPLQYVTREPLPNAFRFTVNGVANSKYAGLTKGVPNQPLYLLDSPATLTYNIPDLGGSRLMPGECRVFSPLASSRAPAANYASINLTKGFKPGGGFFFPLKRDDGSVYSGLPSGATVRATAKFDTAISAQEGGSVGIYLDMRYPSNGGIDDYGDVRLAYRMRIPGSMMNDIYQELTSLGSASVGQASGTPVPFLTTIFGARTASNTHLPAKGFVQSSPLNCYSEVTNMHPVNAGFDYSFEPLTGAGGSSWPGSDASGSGFIVTGFQSADGLKRCIINELPIKPLQSLGELQHWDIRYDNPNPPYSFNIIGNSDATPLIAANSAMDSTSGRHDDSYCANHLLFDDWFVSSITPKSTNFGRPPSSETFQKTFTDFVSGTNPLPNRAYQPIAADVATANTGNLGSLTTFIASRESWRTVASRLEVEGMFNVNSTSVPAWRALLGHARKQKIPFQNATGFGLSNPQDYAFTRFSISGDSEATSIGSSGSFSDCAEFAGYRTLADSQLTQLAVEIVKQVRQRGPFLSLSEFVNRQLSSGNLALAGTIQAALNALADNSSLNPFARIQARSKLSNGNPPLANQTSYLYRQAAIGYNTYGIPGWTRQADVLRSLAPILSARDDTFTIRAYGDARDTTGQTVTARAVCEAVVRRTRDFVNPADAADILTSPTSPINQAFGRRFEIISFRWLCPEEI